MPETTWVLLNKDKISLSRPLQTYQLTATLLPVWAEWEITRASSDETKAVVSQTWLVTCITPGECIITASSAGFSATCSVLDRRTPVDNTVAYFPFKENFNDYKWTRTLTVNDCTITDWTAKVNSQNSYMKLSTPVWWSVVTVNMWYYYNWLSTWWQWNTLLAKEWWTYHHMLIPAVSSSWVVWQIGSYNSNWRPWNITLQQWKWYNIVMIKDWTNEKIYVNKELVLEDTASFDNNANPIWFISNYNTNQTQWAQGNLSEIIFEDKVWTKEEIDDYFEASKIDYWYDINEYQELEYIESSWTQYIDTWYIPKSITEFDLVFSPATYVWTYCTIMGTRKDTNNNALWMWYYAAQDRNYIEFSPANVDPFWISWRTIWTTYNITYHNKILSNWTDSITVNHTQDSLYPLYIFTGDQVNTPTEYSAIKFYSLKLYEWNNLIKDFMPCYRKSDWAIWLLDKVKWEFYPNAWSWTFIKWPKIWLTLNKNRLSLNTPGQTEQLTVSAIPVEILERWISWTSSDTSVATVTQNWLVTCITPWECTITVSTWDWVYTDECVVAPIQEHIIKVEFDSNEEVTSKWFALNTKWADRSWVSCSWWLLRPVTNSNDGWWSCSIDVGTYDHWKAQCRMYMQWTSWWWDQRFTVWWGELPEFRTDNNVIWHTFSETTSSWYTWPSGIWTGSANWNEYWWAFTWTYVYEIEYDNWTWTLTRYNDTEEVTEESTYTHRKTFTWWRAWYLWIWLRYWFSSENYNRADWCKFIYYE